MARMARVVAPGIPHLVSQRGQDGQRTFFDGEDGRVYRELLAERCAATGVEVWAYCLMPAHVDLILVPADPGGLRGALAETHRRYARHVGARRGGASHLWHARYASCPLDEAHVAAAAAYVELNPVRAGLAVGPRDYLWSSARAHLAGRDDGLVRVEPLLARVADWRGLLDAGLTEEDAARLGGNLRTGRPLGDAAFVERLEAQLGRRLKKRKPGPKPRVA